MTFEEFYKRFDFNSDASGSIIGRGGFGVVYKAYDKVRKRFVAVKRSEVGQFVKFELLREVEIANEIDPHPNILRYENIFRISDHMGTYDFAIMKYYPEGNLENVLRKNQLSDTEKKEILTGILEGLAHIHLIPIIHRDFKTANILMDKSPEGNWIPLICDFGQSRLVDTEISMISNNSQIALTPKYSAPEQLLDEKSLRPNADLWAFGVMTYQMVQGKLPFTVEDSTGEWGRSEKIRFLILQGELPKDIALVPEPYQEIIRKCLVVDPEKRVKNASELLDIINKKPESTPAIDITEIENALPNDKTTVFTKITPAKEVLEDKIEVTTIIQPLRYETAVENIQDDGKKKTFNYWLIAPIAAAIALGLFFFFKSKPEPTKIVSEVTLPYTKTLPATKEKQPEVVATIEKPTIIPKDVTISKTIRKNTGNEKSFREITTNSDTGTIAITVNEDCDVSIDGKKYGKIRQNQSRTFTLSGVEGASKSKVHIFKFINGGGDEIVENISIYAGESNTKKLTF